MRALSSLIRQLPAIFLCSPLLLPGAARGQATGTEIDYTGGLLGYFRMEATETTPVLPPVKAFVDFRDADAKNGGHLLLGMGDDFGPEFGAALQLENAPGSPCYQPQNLRPDKETRPESLYKNDDRVALKAQCDNVLNFLMRTGFRALVPGREDFMYTARWLRHSAVLLAEESNQKNESNQQAGSPLIKNDDHRLYLLAANLRVQMKSEVAMRHSGTPGKPYPVTGRCPLLFTSDPFAPQSTECVAGNNLPDTLDWLDRLDRMAGSAGENPTAAALRQLATETYSEAATRQLVLGAVVSDEITIMRSAWEDRFDLSSAFDRSGPKVRGGSRQGLTAATVDGLLLSLPGLPACKTGAKFANADETADAADLCSYRDRLVEILNALKELLLKSKEGSLAQRLKPCSDENGGSSVGACFLLTEQARGAAIEGLLRTIANEQQDIGYTVAQQGGHKFLIVGVVGQDTMKEVSETNLKLCIGAPKNDNWPDGFSSCNVRSNPNQPQHGLLASVLVSDPVMAAAAVVRAAELKNGPFDSVVLMAQMPHTEAEVLATRVWEKLQNTGTRHPIDIVLSEAGETETGSEASETETGFDTPDLSITFPLKAKDSAIADTGHPAPVFTPVNGYDTPDGRFPGAISRASMKWTPGVSLLVANQSTGIYPLPARSGSAAASTATDKTPTTTVSLLYQFIDGMRGKPANISNDSSGRQKAELMLLEELQKASSPHADVVLLQSRDVQLGNIGEGYRNYDVCEGDPNQSLCTLRVALDRILWKGDYLEYVAVTGKDLKAILGLSEDKIEQQGDLEETDISKEWLISYGIVQSTLTNATEINQNNEPLWIPVDPGCKGETAGQSTYCIGGTPISDDAYYWLLTTDQLAQDRAVYGTLQKIPPVNHRPTQTFITFALSHNLLNSLRNSRTRLATMQPPPGSVERAVTSENETFQQMPLWQVDFAKLIASFTSRQPVGGNQFVGGYFQGVSDARASVPTQQDLDLELGGRITGDPFGPTGSAREFEPVSVGFQSEFDYNRSVLGNLTPATRPINASYSLNNLTVGAFLQARLGSGAGGSILGARSLPRNLLVFTPHQYQIEIDNPYLFFPFATASPVPGELTVELPRTTGWTDRGGFRREFGQSKPTSFFANGSYFETGIEFNEQKEVLSALTLQTGSTSKTCHVNANITLQTCFSQAPTLPINNSTKVVGFPAVKSLRSPGIYWDVHLQNRVFGTVPGKFLSLVTDTQGDYYFGRPPAAELPTQTEYAIPLTLSLVIPALGNLSFAPTYSVFFYQSQLSSQSLQVNSFSLAARWYFARDARVPIPRQMPLPGPASADQTKTGKSH